MAKHQQSSKPEKQKPASQGKRNPSKQGGGKRSDSIKPPFRDQGTKQDSSRQFRREEEVADTAAAISRSNPVELYTKYRQFAMDAASLPFATPLGVVLSQKIRTVTQSGSTQSIVTGAVDFTVPGIMRLNFSPTIGVSEDYTSPINRSSTIFFTQLRSNQKAFGNYDHQDITMFEVAVDSCIMFHSLCKRLYGLARNFTPINEYYPNALVAASGGIMADLRQNLQDFRAYINEFAYNLEQFALPSGISLFDRHQWMCEGIYTDSTATRAQTYMFVPTGFWQYDNTVATGSQLTFVKYEGQHTVAQLMAIGDALINAIAGDEDFAMISGDLYAWYKTNTYKLGYVDENYQILPKYDERVLSQIENATIAGPWNPSYTPIISQNPNVNQGAIIFKPSVETEAVLTNTYMNFHHDSPSPDDVLEATRLICTFREKPAAGQGNVATCGTEIVHSVDIFFVNPDTLAFRYNTIAAQVYKFNQGQYTEAQVVNWMADLANLAKFDWAPRLLLYSYKAGVAGAAATWEYIGDSWDTDVMSEVPDNYLKTINIACLFSLFEVAI